MAFTNALADANRTIRFQRWFMVGLTAYALVRKGACGVHCGDFTANLALPHLPFYMVLATAMAVYAAVLAAELVIGLIHFRAERDPNEHP